MIIAEEKSLPLPPSQGQADEGLPPPYISRSSTLGPGGGPSANPSTLESSPTISSDVGPTTTTPRLPAQNRLRVYRKRDHIREQYAIDPSLPAPDTSIKHLNIRCDTGNINAKIWILGADVKQRVELEASTDFGSIKLGVCGRPFGTPVHIVAKSSHGNISVYLPSYFHGRLSIRLKHRNPTILPSLAPYLRTLDDTQEARKYWVGEWQPDENWEGDECSICADWGVVKVGFYEPEDLRASAPATGKKPLLKRLFGSS